MASMRMFGFEVCWVNMVIPQPTLIPLHIDNTSAIQININMSFHQCTTLFAEDGYTLTRIVKGIPPTIQNTKNVARIYIDLCHSISQST